MFKIYNDLQIKYYYSNIVNYETKTSSATDGNMKISYVLLLAHKIWRKNDEIDYKSEAIKGIKALMDSCVNKKVLDFSKTICS